MGQHIFRSYHEPKREGLSWEECWKDSDKGTILCWEIGRELSIKEPRLAERAKNGELPILGWKGGIEKKTKITEKYGTLYYLAQLQGLRGQDLDIDFSKEYIFICSRTGMQVIYTDDLNKVCKNVISKE